MGEQLQLEIACPQVDYLTQHGLRLDQRPFDASDGRAISFMRRGPDDVWQGLPGSTVLNMLAPGASSELYSGHPAYIQLDRRLKELGEELGLEGRIHLHRLRRTVAVQALRVTGDVGAVQQMLGHSSAHTTMTYLDEARPDAVAAVQQRVRERFAEEPEPDPEESEE